MSPAAGTFTVGSTFEVSVFLDTEKEHVNALDVAISFPQDKLQLVSPTAGQSIISVWTGQPRFNNSTGRVDLEGGMPGGINVSNGLVTTLTFRVKSVGAAAVRFMDGSRVLLNDGLGTDVLNRTGNGVYQLILPPPQGPITVSRTHPDQSKWYSTKSVALEWALPGSIAEGFSYLTNGEPIDVPDNISEGVRTSVIYKNMEDGVRYFHIRAYREGAWGGTTHYALNIDSTPPAEFPLEIIPDSRTTRRQPVIQFYTTDALSGIDHYELKVVSLSTIPEAKAANGNQELFVEAQSPYVASELSLGNYDVIVRAYDKAGNIREVTERLEVVTALFRFVGDKGFEIRGGIFIVPWVWVWTLALVLLGVLVFVAHAVRRRHDEHNLDITGKHLPSHLRRQLEELREFRKRYGKALMLFLLVFPIIFGSHVVQAQTTELSPPFITSISRDISDEEIFYAGGKVDVANAEVVLYLQNLRTGETESQVVVADKRGDWFYRHSTFLGAGNYLLWAQARFADASSPPGPQVELSVRPTALHFGASRLSYEALYLVFLLVLLFVVAGLVGYIVYHGLHAREKRKLVENEVREAEESIKRGFAVLRRDIEAELAVVRKAKLGRELKEEERAKEVQLLKDLEWAEKYIGKEMWDIDRVGLDGTQ
ncbi:MAG: cohesin domain-containing protein [Candidatus Brennerbacteria bacterium]